MTGTRAPAAHRVRLRSVSTGEQIERWPVDARELVRVGGYEVVSGGSATASPGEAPATDDSSESGVSPSVTADFVAATPPVDPMPHVTKALAASTALSPTGAPLIIAPPEGVTPAAPVRLPTTRSPARGRR